MVVLVCMVEYLSLFYITFRFIFSSGFWKWKNILPPWNKKNEPKWLFRWLIEWHHAICVLSPGPFGLRLIIQLYLCCIVQPILKGLILSIRNILICYFGCFLSSYCKSVFCWIELCAGLITIHLQHVYNLA